MVTADETVVATTTTEAPAILEEEPKSSDASGNSSDSDTDKIELIQKLKAEQRAAASVVEVELNESTEEAVVSSEEDVTNGASALAPEEKEPEENDGGEVVAMETEEAPSSEETPEVSKSPEATETTSLKVTRGEEVDNGDSEILLEDGAENEVAMETEQAPEVQENGVEKETNGVAQPAETEDVAQPAETEEVAQPAETEEVAQPAENEEVAQPAENVDVAQPERVEDAVPQESTEKDEGPKQEPAEEEKIEKPAPAENDVVTVQDSEGPADVPVSTKQPTQEVQNQHEPEANEDQNGKGVKRTAVECIQLDDDDDDDVIAVEAPAKKPKIDEVKPAPAPPPVKKEEESDDNEKAQKRLLDKLEEYVANQKGTPGSQNRKILDTLLGAINAQVQKEPLSVRKLILDKCLVLPNTISFPPSQVCDLLIEHDPEMPLSKVINRMFGDDRPKLSDSEKRERAQLKLHNPVPSMTKLLVDIGQDLVQEATYCDIVHAKNLPEVPKNMDTYKQVAAQLKPVWETLKRKNEPYKLKLIKCHVCGFQTESHMVMSNHKAVLHQTDPRDPRSKYQCTYCKETDTNEQRMKEHLFEAHLVIAKVEEKEAKYPCHICEEDFNFKGVRETHYKQCKKDYIRIRNIMAPKADDQLMVNRWLWEKPPVDPNILAQQQQAALQAAQQKRQQQAQLQAQQQAQANHAALLRKQQLIQQQQAANRVREQNSQQLKIQQMASLIQQSQRSQANGNAGGLQNNLIAAMQAQLRRSGGGGSSNGSNAVMSQYMAQMAAALKSQKGPLGQQFQSVLAQAALQQQQQQQQQQQKKTTTTPISAKMQRVMGGATQASASAAASPSSSSVTFTCEICDQTIQDKERYLLHLQTLHKQMVGKCLQDMVQGAPLACSRCRDRFWTYEGLERHLVMSHGLVTADLLAKAQKKEDGGRCKTCGKQYAFNMLQHLVADHHVKLCSAEIMYSCDVCSFRCSSYQILEQHLSAEHPKGDKKAAQQSSSTAKNADDCITLDD